MKVLESEWIQFRDHDLQFIKQEKQNNIERQQEIQKIKDEAEAAKLKVVQDKEAREREMMSHEEQLTMAVLAAEQEAIAAEKQREAERYQLSLDNEVLNLGSGFAEEPKFEPQPKQLAAIEEEPHYRVAEVDHFANAG